MTQAEEPMLEIQTEGSRVVFDVLVVPRASRCGVSGVHDGRLKVTLDSPPVDGRANDALIEFFARALGRPKRDVTIVRGEKSRKKTIAIAGVTPADVIRLGRGQKSE
jgi:uncharacterized protein (TIGR00251 family)